MLVIGLLTLSGLTVASIKNTKPELEIQSLGAQVDKIVSKTTVIAEIQVVEEKL
jgi:hypothetical protein